MADALRRPVTAAQIRATEEWRATFPGVEVVWEASADEGEGAGFDNLDLGAHVRAYYLVTAPWEEIVDEFRSRLIGLGWRRLDAAEAYATHQRWTAPDRPGAEIALIHRPPEPWESWTYDPALATVFEVFFHVDPAGSPDSVIDVA
jgi:hypothetical protein